MTGIPTVEVYRGIAIHDFQDRDRIETVVKPAIDQVFAMTDPRDLFDYAADVTRPPEARLLAGDLYAARDELRANDHGRRLGRLDLLAARLAGLEALGWTSPTHYGTLLDRGPAPGEHRGAAPRPPEQGERLMRAQAKPNRRDHPMVFEEEN